MFKPEHVVGCAANPEAPKEEWQAQEIVSLLVRTVPVTKATSRIFVSARLPVFRGKPISWISKLTPTWVRHLERNAVLDGDAIFLHQQSQDMLNGAPHTAPLRGLECPALWPCNVLICWLYYQTLIALERVCCTALVRCLPVSRSSCTSRAVFPTSNDWCG